LSYDVQVFAQRALSSDDVRTLLGAAGLKVDEEASSASSLTVVRGARVRYSFTLGSPVPIEAEDVPEEVTAVLLGTAYLYELMVEGSSATETPHAVRFARRLATASDGVVVDQQSGEVWTRGKSRAVPVMQRGMTDIVEVRWYVPPEGTGARAADAWLSLARRHLPEALPRRFGPVEPLSMKLESDGAGAFVDAVAAETMSVYFKGTAPCIEGSMAGGAGRPGVRSHGLSVHRGALVDPRWRDAVRRLFVEFAAATAAVYASAEVVRGVEWSGRSVGFGPAAERVTYLAARGRWAGLPPYPVWWSWFSPEYTPLVRDHLPADEVVDVGAGMFHGRGGEPLDRGQLTAALVHPAEAPRRGLSNLFSRRPTPTSPATWLPAHLLPVVDESDPRLHNPPLTRATTLPGGLQPDH
jgi:hypothetical protein